MTNFRELFWYPEYLGDSYVVILIFSSCFALAFFLTKSYKFLDKYYSTVHFVACTSLLYQVICRGHLLWRFRNCAFLTEKLSYLIQFSVLFPCTTVLFLRYLPRKAWAKVFYILGFVGLYVLMEWLLVVRREIIYQYGWRFGWSVFIDFWLFLMAWIHSRSWKVAVPIAVCIILFLMVWFRIPLSG